MMSLILFLIVAVAAFNIVAMLVMVVTDKRTDIAILRTFGASPRKIMGVFITQGLVIGWSGVAVGLGSALLIAFNVGTIEPFLEHTFGFQIFDSDVYYITTIPSDVQLAEYHDHRGRGLPADRHRDVVSGDPRVAHAARRSAAVRVVMAAPTNGSSARATCARRIAVDSSLSSRSSRCSASHWAWRLSSSSCP